LIAKGLQDKRREDSMNATRRPLILVIDDDAEVLTEVAEVTSAAGYACHGCATGEAAVEFTRSHVPDLIISDTNLEGQSGLALCERLKKDPALRRTPVMFLSRTQVPDIIRRSHSVGGTYYLRKPLDPMVLVELIDKALRMPYPVRTHADCQPQPAASE
jgi:CheY-like chemotaxis protein